MACGGRPLEREVDPIRKSSAFEEGMASICAQLVFNERRAAEKGTSLLPSPPGLRCFSVYSSLQLLVSFWALVLALCATTRDQGQYIVTDCAKWVYCSPRHILDIMKTHMVSELMNSPRRSTFSASLPCFGGWVVRCWVHKTQTPAQFRTGAFCKSSSSCADT